MQADAILNMRLRNLRKLEEQEIRTEDRNLRSERTQASATWSRPSRDQWKNIADEIKAVRTTFGPKTPLGKRRTSFAQAPEHDEAAIDEAMAIREPITVVVSQKGWVRALKGIVTDLSGVVFKADDALALSRFPAETTSKCLIFATNGRFYTIEAAKLPGGRGHGEPVRLFIDLEQEADLVAVVSGGRRTQVLGREPGGAAASWSPKTSASPTPARASRCSTSTMPDEARALCVDRGRDGRRDRR